jgi:hypothetical protein
LTLCNLTNKIKTNSENSLPPGDLKMDFTNEGKKKTNIDVSFLIGESNVTTGHEYKMMYSKLPMSHFRGHFEYFSYRFTL